MGINTTIFEGIRHNTDEYGISPLDARVFLTEPNDFLTRQAIAIGIIEAIMTTHQKQELLRHVVQLARVEHGIRELEPWVRDHVVHALLSFLLGIFINEHLLKPSGLSVNAFQWKLAGLFHDVGYPAQVAKDILKPYTDQINSIKRALAVNRPDVFFRVIPVGLAELTNGINGLDLIQGWLDRWGLRINAREEYSRMVESGDVCHGIISFLSVLYVIDMMYQKYNPQRVYADIHEPPGINWNQSYFENHVVPACAAVFVHNMPARCFRIAPLDRTRALLPFLLRLSDSLQDWDRPSADDPRGVPDDNFDINVVRDRLVFTVTDPVRRNRIEEELGSSIVALDIDVM